MRKLPQRTPVQPVGIFVGDPAVIARLVRHLKHWQPSARLEVDTEASTPTQPLWGLRVWS